MNDLLSTLDARQPLLTRLGLAFFALFPALVLMMVFEDRQITGANLWLKPAKFAISISVYLLTMAWLLGELRRWRVLVWCVAIVVAGSMLLEQVLITMQAARETTSHYNFTTSFDALVFSLMGFGVAANSAAAGLALLLFAFHRDPDRPGYLWGIRLGLLIFLAGSIEGFAMIDRGAHTVGAPDGGPGIPGFRWSTVAGDLRVAHFLGIHAIQVLPAAGWFMDRLADERWPRLAGTGLVAGAYGLLTWLAFQAALTGRPGL